MAHHSKDCFKLAGHIWKMRMAVQGSGKMATLDTQYWMVNTNTSSTTTIKNNPVVFNTEHKGNTASPTYRRESKCLRGLVSIILFHLAHWLEVLFCVHQKLWIGTFHALTEEALVKVGWVGARQSLRFWVMLQQIAKTCKSQPFEIKVSSTFLSDLPILECVRIDFVLTSTSYSIQVTYWL